MPKYYNTVPHNAGDYLQDFFQDLWDDYWAIGPLAYLVIVEIINMKDSQQIRLRTERDWQRLAKETRTDVKQIKSIVKTCKKLQIFCIKDRYFLQSVASNQRSDLRKKRAAAGRKGVITREVQKRFASSKKPTLHHAEKKRKEEIRKEKNGSALKMHTKEKTPEEIADEKATEGMTREQIWDYHKMKFTKRL